MTTPTQTQARSHYATQARTAAAAGIAVKAALEQRTPFPEVLALVALYQLAAATQAVAAIARMASSALTSPLTIPSAFAGVSSGGFPVAEPIIATIDKYAPAPVEAVPTEPWWDDASAFAAEVERLVASQVHDAGVSASQVEIVARPDWTNYVRMLVLPSCPRCVVLAGRVYRDLDAFSRHPPTCDCVMIPVTDWQEAHDNGLVSSPREAFEKGGIVGLSKADERAIRDGANIAKVVNASRGMYTTDLFGRRVKATTEATTKRAAWRKANPSTLVRLRPESIYRYAESHEDALRLLRRYGYLTS